MVAVAKYAFFSSPYPLILSLEVHCSKPQQVMMADIMKCVPPPPTELAESLCAVEGLTCLLLSRRCMNSRSAFGEMLALPFADGERDRLPSPEELKYKILLKGAYHSIPPPPNVPLTNKLLGRGNKLILGCAVCAHRLAGEAAS